jgi:FixJ family two-component response regulator
MKAGAVDFLEMPCKPEALLAAVAPRLGAARHSESLLVEIERASPIKRTS